MDTDPEKGPSSPSSPTFTHNNPHPYGAPPIPHISLRRRRLISQILLGVGFFSIAGWVIWGMDADAYLARGRPIDASIPGIPLGADGTPYPILFEPDPPSSSSSSSPSPTASSDKDPNHVLSHAEKMAAQGKIKPQSWGLDLNPDHLTAGLSPWPAKPEVNESKEPLSVLGHFADGIYDYGPEGKEEYARVMREFVKIAFPKAAHTVLLKGLDHFLGDSSEEGGDWAWDKEKFVWQTDKDGRRLESPEVKSWRGWKTKNEKWEWDLLTDKDAEKWVKKVLAGSRVRQVWDGLPSGILRSDMLRYLLLLLRGGIYSDTDTTLLKPPSKWGAPPTTPPVLFNNGDGWLTPEQKERLEAGESHDEVLGRASVVVGVEADVGDREDWYDWWPRPIQIVQWTMASTPSHPIALNALLRILHATSTAIHWSHTQAKVVKILLDQGRYADAESLAQVTALNEPKNGGPVGVMAWTGPGVWTDAVLSYLKVGWGMRWVDLKGLREPMRVGDVLILPVTGFSPGVGNFGAQQRGDPQAMVEHGFAGSWKTHGEP
ncbi:hypothetical protein L198_07393 [Cryptococcus wingfieldii CBS 7118]|uniref:Alpha 1,6-mannosyltransferase n=1 Tax=Cryptococcus wingfieldii CBS 7118 TaxID=1295528 RepID=A0A1E3IBX6_9TREE|nr:hypothetical protein L198_07393 [Cryptococcus wingfieldii CBS 7118]ODN86100.1 hypothetical protein L198_07393 [Cryptococcus wingfieldii CBS 7118]